MSIFGGLASIAGDYLQGRPIGYELVAEQVLQGSGGLDGILNQLRQSGLGEHVESWIGNGENIPISADQIKAAISSEQLEGIASKFGINVDQVSHLLAEHLPNVVGNATSTGEAQA